MRVPSKEVLWKIDWPMRWLYEGVDFEPGGKDHAAPGGSYNTSRVIAKEISSCFFINQQTLITLIAEENIKNPDAVDNLNSHRDSSILMFLNS